MNELPSQPIDKSTVEKNPYGENRKARRALAKEQRLARKRTKKFQQYLKERL